jgi:hypothetical protein
MKVTGRLKDQSGHASTFYLIAIVGIVAAIIIPMLINARDHFRALDCFNSLVEVANGHTEPGDAVCRLSSLPVHVEETDGVNKFFLAKLKGTFFTEPVFTRSGDTVTFDQNFPAGPVKDTLKNGLTEQVTVKVHGDLFILHHRGTVAGIILLFAGGLLTYWAVSRGGGCLMGLFILVPILLMMVANVITARSVLIDPDNRAVRIQTTYLGFIEKKQAVFENPAALVPIRSSGNRAAIVLLYRPDNILRTRNLFDLNPSDIVGLKPVENALKGIEGSENESGAVTSPDLPAEPSENPGKGKGSFFSKVIILLIHFAVLLAGGIFIVSLAESVRGAGSFNLPMMWIYIVSPVGAGLSLYYGWRSTGILLSGYGILRLTEALYERLFRR